MRTFPRRQDSAATIGMIDDGSAEVQLDTKGAGELSLRGVAGVDLDWFLALRCEQIASGRPLVAMLEGIAEAVPMSVAVTVCNLGDTHHTWEGVFRSVGIAFHRLMAEPPDTPARDENAGGADKPGAGDWSIVDPSPMRVEVVRTTAESLVRVLLDLEGFQEPVCRFEVADSIHVDGLRDLLRDLSREAGFRLDVDFKATRLSSSHVVMEDVGMVVGRALKEIFIQRMRQWGVNGAGSSVHSADDLERTPIHVGLSVEGRKFWTFIPFTMSDAELRQSFLIGHDVGRGLFSEDLDDFIDGLTGGLTASVVVHVRKPVAPEKGWPILFQSLGKAIAEALDRNPQRKGVIPGVKATLT